ncbi:MAG: hypothetical protein ACE5EO_06880, partial [Candidatus Krumholzibacteriia bacterium]
MREPVAILLCGVVVLASLAAAALARKAPGQKYYIKELAQPAPAPDGFGSAPSLSAAAAADTFN